MVTLTMNNMKLLVIALTMYPLLASCGENPIQKFRINITDESGKPVSGVTGKAWFNTSHPGGIGIDSYLVTGVSDNAGVVELQGKTIHYQTAIGAEMTGFYPASKGAFWMKGKSGNQWLPSPVEEKLVMKKIFKPISMYAAGSGEGMRIDFPKGIKNSYGFDLMVRDWVAPHGKGKNADFIFEQFDGFSTNPQEGTTGKLTLSFPNDGDGILAMHLESHGGSYLRSPSEAPTGSYAKTNEFTSKPLELMKVKSEDLENMVWVFRIRTKKDSEGNIVSTHYGKIYGYPQVMSMRGLPALRFTYYVNGVSNDCGLEWDMKTNLIENLPKQNWPQNP